MNSSGFEEQQRSADQAAEVPKRPVALVGSVILMLFICVLAIVLGVMITVEAYDHGDEAGGVAGILATAIGVIDLVLTVLVWMGRSWARVVLAVLVVANLVIGLISGQGPSGLLGLVAVALMFSPPSNEWFNERRPAG